MTASNSGGFGMVESPPEREVHEKKERCFGALKMAFLDVHHSLIAIEKLDWCRTKPTRCRHVRVACLKTENIYT